MSVQATIHELAAYALAKKGAELEAGGFLSASTHNPCVRLPGTSWGNFFDVHDQTSYAPCLDGTFARLPMKADRVAELQKTCPTICEAKWMPRDGHIEIAVPLDEGLPIEFLKALIDEAYQLIWQKLNDKVRFKIDRAAGHLDGSLLLHELIDLHELQARRKEITQVARPAILLRPTSSEEPDIPLGTTKLGGMPDLPPMTEWPVFQDGKPMAFLGQIDLSDIARHGQILAGLPTHGLLSVFSVWGRVSEQGIAPHTPSTGWKEQDGWTAILHFASTRELARRPTPEGVNSFAAAKVEPVLILSVPNHRREPALAGLGWTDAEYKRFDEMQSEYQSIVMGHWLKKMDSSASYHQLGGYALFQQGFPSELLEKQSVMLLQVGSDRCTGMCWEDGGELAFYVNESGLRNGRIEQAWVDCQSG